MYSKHRTKIVTGVVRDQGIEQKKLLFAAFN